MDYAASRISKWFAGSGIPKAYQAGADIVISKSASAELLGILLKIRESLKMGCQSTSLLNGIVGTKSGLEDLLERARRCARIKVPVLITGESGTGKEEVARFLRDAGARDGKPFLVRNMSQFQESLIASELFGHEKGAFTNATAEKKGIFEEADGGTVFLDEIANLSLECQGKLLRVLENGTFNRVGGNKELEVDVQVIAATSRDLTREIKNGRFLRDLYYRLNIIRLNVKPLRERREFIRTLTVIVAARIAAETAVARNNKTFAALALRDLTDAAFEKLENYAWPGNVRELKSVLYRAMINAEGPAIDVTDLEFDDFSELPNAEGGGTELTPSIDYFEQFMVESRSAKQFGFFEWIEQIETNVIGTALEQSHGIVAGSKGAAALLGVNPNTLASRIKTRTKP